MVIKEKFLINLIFLLTLFPFFKFVPFITAEVQPVAAVFALIYLIAKSKGKKIKHTMFYSVTYFVLITYFLVSLALAYFSVDYSMSYVFQTAVIVAAPFVVFMALRENLHLVSIKLFRISITLWALMSISQNYLSNFLDFSHISDLMKLLIPRWSAASLESIDRGVMGFAPEPSYAAYQIFFMFVFSIFLYRKSLLTKSQMAYFVSLTLIMIYLNKSGTLYMIMLIFAIPYLIRLLFSIRTWWFAVLLLTFAYLMFPYVSDTTIRPVKIMLGFFNYFLDGQIDFVSFINLNRDYGSSRMTQTLIGYYNIFLSHGFGSGLGSWSYKFSDTVDYSGFVGHNGKPFSYVSLLAFDTGVFGLVAVSLFYYKTIAERFRREPVSVFGWSCLLTSMFSLYISSPTSLPTLWIVLLIFYSDSPILQTVKNKFYIKLKLRQATI